MFRQESSAEGFLTLPANIYEMFPMFVDISAKRVVVFGGGNVAERKVRQILESGCRNIEVYSLDFADELKKRYRNGEIECIKCDLWHADIDKIVEGAFIVIICTDDDALNERIYEIARFSSSLVNYGDKGDMFMSSVIRKDGFIIAISTSGSSPAMARRMKRRIASVICDDDAKMLRIQTWLRAHLRNFVHDPNQRREILNNVLNSSECWEALDDDIESAKARIANFVDSMIEMMQKCSQQKKRGKCLNNREQ